MLDFESYRTVSDSQSIPGHKGLMEKALALLNNEDDSKMNAQGSAKVEKAIIVKNGIFTINTNLSVSQVKLDPTLMQLIESVLR